MKRRATVIFERDERVLLVARARGRWAFPGGRAKRGEELVDAAACELMEETQLVAEGIRYASQFRGLRTRHSVFVTTVSPDAKPTPSNEIARSGWLPLHELGAMQASVLTRGIAEVFLRQTRCGRGVP
ncbi:NUDIX hydrolase [Caballeronia cordobensis]|uniref:NUDIX hydrolase n=1 Tax=Caballeronia cordobensis TaxID=1353886 RepID=UPI00094FDCD6|nr:NUDIX domain-containing protein [Caballeronia cordobensis]